MGKRKGKTFLQKLKSLDHRFLDRKISAKQYEAKRKALQKKHSKNNPCPKRKTTTIHLKRIGAKIKIKKGALSKYVGIPEEKNIPKTLLLKIKGAKKGTTIRNPTKSGKRNIKVTSTTKKQATLALTLKGFKD